MPLGQSQGPAQRPDGRIGRNGNVVVRFGPEDRPSWLGDLLRHLRTPAFGLVGMEGVEPQKLLKKILHKILQKLIPGTSR